MRIVNNPGSRRRDDETDRSGYGPDRDGTDRRVHDYGVGNPVSEGKECLLCRTTYKDEHLFLRTNRGSLFTLTRFKTFDLKFYVNPSPRVDNVDSTYYKCIRVSVNVKTISLCYPISVVFEIVI